MIQEMWASDLKVFLLHYLTVIHQRISNKVLCASHEIFQGCSWMSGKMIIIANISIETQNNSWLSNKNILDGPWIIIFHQ